MTLSLDGLVSGLGTSDLIAQLMQIERQPQTRLRTTRAGVQNVIDAYRGLNTKLAAVQTAAKALTTAASWQAMKATSSAPSVATVAAGPNALPATLGFTVDNLATAHSVVSAGTVSGTAVSVAGGPFLLSRGADALGFSTLSAGATLALGTHSVSVVEASSGAAKTGTGPLAPTTTITTGVDDTLLVEVDGVAATYTLGAGSYDPSQLAAAVAVASGGDLRATIGADGALRLETTHEGSAATLRVVGGSALGDLALVPDAAALAGTDALVDVAGTVTAIADVRAGVTVSLASGRGGSVSAVLGGGVRRGTVTATNVDTGDGSLASVVAAVNASGAGVSAAAVRVGSAGYRLQLASTSTGAASRLTVDLAAFSASTLGSLATLTEPTDSAITVGSGPGAYRATSGTNTFADLLPGVTVTATSTGSATLTVARDAEALADKVRAVVDAANGALREINRLTDYDADSKVAGKLLGDSVARRLQQQVVDAVIDTVASSALGSVGRAGVESAKDGTLTFDRAEFLARYAEAPDAAAALFRQGGTATNGAVTLLTASDRTRAGTYAVVVTAAAARGATAGSAVPGGTLAAAETIDLRVGTSTVSYTAAAGESLQSVAAGLNRLAAEAGFGLVADVDAGALVVRTAAYGSAASFAVRTSAAGAAAGQTGIAGVATPASTWVSFSGSDVAGTIGGVAGVGTGQVLTVEPAASATAGGLALKITATAAEVAASTDFGTFTYTPGVAQRLSTVVNDAIDTTSGLITTAIGGRTSELTRLDDQIAAWDGRLAQREAALRRRFTAMETALGALRQQTQWLAGQLGSLPSNSGAR